MSRDRDDSRDRERGRKEKRKEKDVSRSRSRSWVINIFTVLILFELFYIILTLYIIDIILNFYPDIFLHFYGLVSEHNIHKTQKCEIKTEKYS